MDKPKQQKTNDLAGFCDYWSKLEKKKKHLKIPAHV